jgi:MFS family permease
MNLAPPRLRGRYLSVFGLTSEVGSTLGPVVGSLLNDHVAPNAVWYGGLAIGLGAAAGFWALLRCARLPVHPWGERT